MQKMEKCPRQPRALLSALPPLSQAPSRRRLAATDVDPCPQSCFEHCPPPLPIPLIARNHQVSGANTGLARQDSRASELYRPLNRTMSPIHPSDCKECAENCDGPCCAIQLTPQCTDQCVVVACNDDHKDTATCEDGHVDVPCDDLFCTDDTGCVGFGDSDLCCQGFHPQPAGATDYNMHNESLPFGWDSPFSDSATMLYGPGAYSLPTGMTNPASSSSMSMEQFNTSISASYSQPQLVLANSTTPYSSSNFSYPPLSPVPSFVSDSIHQTVQQAPTAVQTTSLKCMWADCNARFDTMAELVGHVNLLHLRLPAINPEPQQPSSSQVSSPSKLGDQYHNMSDTFSCLWNNCHLYPSPNFVPGSSTGQPVPNAMDILAMHLMHDHLGVPDTTLSNSHQAQSHDTPMRPDSSRKIVEPQPRQAIMTPTTPTSTTGDPEEDPKSGLRATPPLTPCPEHDCSGESSHKCHWTGCGVTYSTCMALTEHINATHVGSGKAHYECFWDGCNRNGENGFSSKQKICRHLQSHTGHRPFQCKVCHQFFSEAATLAQHMRRHTQEKPYVCDFPGCGKSFAIAGALTIHKRTHNGHKPFKCSYCDRAFSESSNLSKHLRTHTGVRPYSCTFPGCKKNFARPDQLSRHMAVHAKKANASSKLGEDQAAGEVMVP